MARRKRTLPYNILVVCEGTVTEPNYFYGLSIEATGISDQEKQIVVHIDPKPRLAGEEVNGSSHKSARKKRQLQKRDSIIEGEVEDEYTADPVRYIRLAQLELSDGTYDEAYAIIDKDGHPAAATAFELAEEDIDGKKVRIGFSSISFEQWVLLHFERSIYPFEKSECKDSKGRYLGCGTANVTHNCKGSRCVAGYIRAQNFLSQAGNPSYQKNGRTLWTDLRPNLDQAMRNAATLRQIQRNANPKSPIHELNPYSDLDLVIASILRLPSYAASEIGQTYPFRDLSFTFEKTASGGLSLRIDNSGGKTSIAKSRIYFSDKNGKSTNGDLTFRERLEPEEKHTVPIPIPTELDQKSGYVNLEISSTSILTLALA